MLALGAASACSYAEESPEADDSQSEAARPDASLPPGDASGVAFDASALKALPNGIAAAG